MAFSNWKLNTEGIIYTFWNRTVIWSHLNPKLPLKCTLMLWSGNKPCCLLKSWLLKKSVSLLASTHSNWSKRKWNARIINNNFLPYSFTTDWRIYPAVTMFMHFWTMNELWTVAMVEKTRMVALAMLNTCVFVSRVWRAAQLVLVISVKASLWQSSLVIKVWWNSVLRFWKTIRFL